MIEIEERNEITGRVIKINPLNRQKLSKYELDEIFLCDEYAR